MPGRAAAEHREGNIAEGLGREGWEPLPKAGRRAREWSSWRAWRGTKRFCREPVSGRGSRRVRQVRQRERESSWEDKGREAGRRWRCRSKRKDRIGNREEPHHSQNCPSCEAVSVWINPICPPEEAMAAVPLGLGPASASLTFHPPHPTPSLLFPFGIKFLAQTSRFSPAWPPARHELGTATRPLLFPGGSRSPGSPATSHQPGKGHLG